MLTVHGGPPLDMDHSESRDRLRHALADTGIVASDSALGGGLRALEVVIIPDDGREALSLLIGSLDGPCEVGLSGYRTIGEAVINCAQAEPLRPETQAQAVDAVRACWRSRDASVLDFRAGAYDLT